MLSNYCWHGTTVDTALRLAKCLGTTPEFGMNLQSAHDLSRASAESGRDINIQVEPLSDAAA